MTGAHNFFRIYALVICDYAQPRGMSRTLTLCLQFPIVTTTLWGQLAGKTRTVLPRSMLLYCTAMFVKIYQTPTFPPHCGDNVNVKTSIFTRLWISSSCSGVGVKQRLRMTGALFIAYEALRMNI